jgi:hypothetical protein
MPAKNKVLSRLSSLWIARTTVAGAATTLNAAAAKAAGTLTVASIANGSRAATRSASAPATRWS